MNVEDEIHEIKKSLAIINERYKNDKDFKDEVKKLTISVNQLLLIQANKDGVQEGVSKTKKWFWTIFGSLIITWILWVSASIEILKTGIHK